MDNHNFLRWKPVKCLSTKGNLVDVDLPDVIDCVYRGTLLVKILSMQKAEPISFEAAMNLVAEEQKAAFAAGRMGSKPGQHCWFTDSFIEFISGLGYHIELSGDEFEAYTLTENYI